MTGAGTRDVSAPAIAVTPASPADAPAIAALDGLEPATVRLLASELGADDRTAVVARPDGGAVPSPRPDGAATTPVVGYAAARLTPDAAEILDVVVDPAWRRRGVATRLLTGLLDAVRQRGAAAATLEVRAGNLGARALYGHLGFVVEGRRPGYYRDGEDALLLWLRDLTTVSDGAAEEGS